MRPYALRMTNRASTCTVLVMSKYRCPVCGATHKEQPTHCRLCGQDMTGTGKIPAFTGGSRPAAVRKGGLGSVLLIAVIGVVAIAVLALVMGFTGSNDFIDNIREKIPGLAPAADDGWTALDDAAGGFVAELPEEREKQFVSFPPAANGRLDQWSSVIGDETDLTISYGRVSTQPGQSAAAALVSLGDTWALSTGAKIDDTTETTFRGFPAIELDLRNLTFGEQTATAKAMMVLRGDTVYVLQSLSVYPDHPQYGRLLSGFQFTA